MMDPEQSFRRRQERAAIAQRNRRLAGSIGRLERVVGLSKKASIRRAAIRAPVRQAGITSPGKAVVAAVLRTPVFRAALRRIPGISRFVPGSKVRVAKLERQLGFPSAAAPTALAVRGGAPLGRVGGLVRPAAKIAAVGGTFAVGEEVVKRALGGVFQSGGLQQAPRRQQVARGGALAVGHELPPSHTVVRVWQTFPGGPRFARLADGHIAVEKKDGTIKHFRPYRPVVIPRKWNARSMSRVATALKRQRKTATKIMQITGGMPKGRR